jgi:hypothetical protein
MISTVLIHLQDFLSLKKKNDENIPSKSNKQKHEKIFFFGHLKGH